MTCTSRGVGASLLVACSVFLAACDGSAEPAVPTASSSDAATATPPSTEAPKDEEQETTAAPTLSAQEKDEVDITTTLEDYTAALDAAKNGDASIEGIYPYATGTAREQWITQILSYEAQGLTLTGETSLEVVDLSVDGDNAEVVACVDLSETDAVDEDGESVLPADHLKMTLVEYVLVRGDGAETGWLVTGHVNQSEPCDG